MMAPMPFSERPSVDTRRERSLSFAPPVASAAEAAAQPRDAAGPGRPAIDAPPFLAIGESRAVSGYPVQPSKVQCPPLRDDTLARGRLLDWLNAKIHHRVVFVVAEAGYGKTTLLADFSRRSRLRTLWYRLEEEDATWVAFLSHLVAAGREHDPEFAPATRGMLAEVATAAPSFESVLDTFIQEFRTWAEPGAVLLLDDFHAVDESPDIRLIMKELLARSPERVAFLIASRRTPALPVARLRAQGEVVELGTDDLRFNEAETEQLFRESYGRPLEPDVLNDLSRRTEGWAASLQLVHAAIRNRTSSEIRSFVRSLSGADGDVYDYLAEEVVGTLPAEVQHFVMSAALLEHVDVAHGAVAAGISEEDAQTAFDAAAAAGLLTRRGRGQVTGRFHPLVAEFLRERCARDLGRRGLDEIHRRVAAYARDRNWRTAARHFIAAGDAAQAGNAISAHLANISSEGAYEEAVRLWRLSSGPAEVPAGQILLARVDIQRGNLDRAAAGAAAALSQPRATTEERELALATLLTVTVNSGEGERARQLARQLLDQSSNASLRAIAEATLRLIEISVGGNLPQFREELQHLAERQRAHGQMHYLGVTLLNISDCFRVEGRFEDALRTSSDSIDALRLSSAGMELAMAHSVRAWALAHLYGIEAAESDCQLAMAIESPIWRLQVLSEITDIRGLYGDPTAASVAFDDLDVSGLPPSVARPLVVSRARSLVRSNKSSEALALLSSLPAGSATATPAFEGSLRTTLAMAAAHTGRQDAGRLASAAVELCERQGAGLWLPLATVARAYAAPAERFGDVVHLTLQDDVTVASMGAEFFARRLDHLQAEDLALVWEEAQRRPIRWRPALRAVVDEFESESTSAAAAALLDTVGDRTDVSRLRVASRRFRRTAIPRAFGRQLARRLAPRVVVEDLGRVAIKVGDLTVPAAAIRRKVLALVCFLVSQPGFAATRDKVLDALWPEQDPAQALNSLNQTLYFLRRVIEPTYDEDLSPGYVHHDAELVWLDTALVRARSAQCRDLLQSLPASPEPEAVERIAQAYVAPFALDFEYDEWATDYRDWLHAAYLEAVEAAIRAATDSGQFARGIRLAQRVLAVDRAAEHVELSLLRLYRQSGAHAAAAEEYARYAAAYRANLGLEPPPLDQL